MKYSVIDISSSSISMTVAEVSERVTEIIFKDRASLTLLHYLDGRKLSERGIEKLVEAVAVMKDKCVSLSVDVLYLIATAALRAIENFEEVGEVILRETGVPVNLIDGKTEAYCDVIANRFFSSYERAVLVDIGGASIEICDLAGESPEDMLSLDFGILNIHNKFVEKIQPDESEAQEIKKYLARKFDKAGVPEKGRYSTVVLVGATNLALYDVYAEYVGAKGEESPREMAYKKFKKLVKHLLCGANRSKLILDVAPEKLYSVGVAAIVAKAVFKRFGADNLLVSDRGVKEGYLQLVFDGKQQGACYDFAKGGSFKILQTNEDAPSKAAKKPAKKSGSAAAGKGKTAAAKNIKSAKSAGRAAQNASASAKGGKNTAAKKSAASKNTAAEK